MNSHPYLTSMPQATLERRPKQFQKVAAKIETNEEGKELLSVRNRQSTLLTEPNEAEKENKIYTVRKRYRCEDYIETQELKLQAMERAYEGDGNKDKDTSPQAQSKKDDKQLEYFKSDEYKKYLQALTQMHGKYDLLRGIKQNRNNNVYLGKGDRKQYIQSIIKTKEVLPRVCLPKFDHLQPKQEEFQPNLNKRQYNQQFVRVEAKNMQIDEESPIKYSPIFETRDKKMNQTIGLQPVCMQKNEEEHQQRVRYTEPTSYKHSFPRQTTNFTPTAKLPQQKPPQNNATAYEKQTKEENYIEINTERCWPRKDKSSKKPILRYKIEEKENSPIKSSPQSSQHYSISSSPRKNHNINIYDMSFKIQQPRANKQSYLQSKSPILQKNIKRLTQRYQEKIYHHAEPTSHRIFTESGLHYSHTNSTATKAEHPKPHKISLISKSKLKL